MCVCVCVCLYVCMSVSEQNESRTDAPIWTQFYQVKFIKKTSQIIIILETLKHRRVIHGTGLQTNNVNKRLRHLHMFKVTGQDLGSQTLMYLCSLNASCFLYVYKHVCQLNKTTKIFSEQNRLCVFSLLSVLCCCF